MKGGFEDIVLLHVREALLIFYRHAAGIITRFFFDLLSVMVSMLEKWVKRSEVQW